MSKNKKPQKVNETKRKGKAHKLQKSGMPTGVVAEITKIPQSKLPKYND